MKYKIIFIYIVSVLIISCDMKEPYEQIDSAAVDYAGQWYFQVKSADMATDYKIYDASTLLTYNTAADVANEIWIDDEGKSLLNLKFRSNFSGDANSFSSGMSDNSNYLATPMPLNLPDTAGLTTQVVQYRQCEVIEGKILLDAATTKTGNKADSIYLSVRMVENTANFTSIGTPGNYTWSAQGTTEQNIERVIAGHRYSGFYEDMY